MADAVCVTGLGCLCAAGADLAETLATLYAGRRQPGPPRVMPCEHDLVYPVFELPQHAAVAADGRTSRSLAMALAAARQALRQAGLTADALAGRRVGVCIGSSTGAAPNLMDFHARQRAGRPSDTGELALWRHANPGLGLAGRLALDGPVQTVVNACSSGSDAIGVAMSWLQSGLCDIVLAGGCDELSPVPYNGFIRLMIYDSAPCRPFDGRRKGLNLGEGAGMLVLERRRHAERRGAEALAVAAGFGSAADAHHLTAPHPEGRSLRRALGQALAQAGIDAGQVDFINAHGTATPNNDRVEAHVLGEIFPATPLVATKGYTGHTLGAAGAIEAVLTVAALRDGRLPASIGCEQPDPDLAVTPVRTLTPLAARYGLSESLGFGGNNAVLVFGRGDVA